MMNGCWAGVLTLTESLHFVAGKDMLCDFLRQDFINSPCLCIAKRLIQLVHWVRFQLDNLIATILKVYIHDLIGSFQTFSPGNASSQQKWRPGFQSGRVFKCCCQVFEGFFE